MKAILTALFILATAHAHAVTNLVYAGLPRGVHQVTVLTNLAFITGYSEYYRAPLWTCYRIDSVTNRAAPPRPGNFRVDKRTKARVKPSDFTNTGYDRGHMAPSYGIGLSHGADAQRETFLMSNVILQSPTLNRGPWKRLESLVTREWAPEWGKIWVVTGPVFKGTNRINGMRVPFGSYKILIAEDSPGKVDAVAFYITPGSRLRRDLKNYLYTVDVIEAITGLDFFHELPDELENRIEGVLR